MQARRTYSREEIEHLAQRVRRWDVWGEEDEIGAGNFVTPSTVRAAAGLVRTGKVFSLALPMDRSGPQTGTGLTGRSNVAHFMTRDGGDIAASAGDTPHFDGTDDAVLMHLQGSTQWDALAHAFYDNLMYNGRPTTDVDSFGARRNSVTAMKDRALGRGVLLNLPRMSGRQWLEPGEAVRAADLAACAQAQGVEIGEGDFVLVRTGQIAQCRARGGWGDYAGGPAPGLAIDCAEFLVDQRVTAVASDTWGLEVRPPETPDVAVPVHVLLLVNAGIHIGEMWDLEALAEDCDADGVYEVMLVAPPLTITGAVGSPVNPLAIK